MIDADDDDGVNRITDEAEKKRTPAASMTDVTTGTEMAGNEACLKSAPIITVNGDARMDALKLKKFTKARPSSYLMPFMPDGEADEWLNENMSNLFACILIDDMSEALVKQLEILKRYIDKYGLRFVKEQHVKLIKTIYGLFVRPKQNASIVTHATLVFVLLVIDSKLTRADLVLDWRPIFDLYERVLLGKEEFIAPIHEATLASTDFYEKGSEKEIWKRIRHYISPSTMQIAAGLIDYCMPSSGYEKNDLEMKKGDLIDDHFLPVLWHFYEREKMADFYNIKVVRFFVRLTVYSPSAVLPFFHQHINLIFSRLMRSLVLTDMEVRRDVSIESSTDAYDWYGLWIGHMLGTHPSVETHLLRLLSVVESHMHPSRNGPVVSKVILISNLQLHIAIVTTIMKRCRRELQAKMKKAEPKPNEIPPLAESTITGYVKAMLPILVPSLHSELSEVADELLSKLAFLRPGLCIPKILDLFYSSLSSHSRASDPKRLTNSLSALKRVLILIATDRVERAGYNEIRQPTKKDWLSERDKMNAHPTREEEKAARVSDQDLRTDTTQTESDVVLSLRPHLVYIAEALIECIDIKDTNDTDRSAMAYEVFTLLFAVMPIVDCSKAEKEGIAYSEEEHRLIQLSKRLKDIILKFVDKTFVIIKVLNLDLPSVDNISSKNSRVQGSDDCLERCISDAFCMLVTNVDDEIGKLICENVLLFVRTSLIHNSIFARTIRVIIVNCVFFRSSCVGDFLEFIVDKIGEIGEGIDGDVHSTNLSKWQKKRMKKRGKEVEWLAAITPGFCWLKREDLHKNLDQLLEMSMKLLASKNEVLYEAGCSCLSNMLTSLLGSSPIYTQGQWNYTLLPSKLWGATVDGLRMKTQWSHPVKADLKAAEKILDVTLFTEMRRLAKPEELSKEQLHKSIAIIFDLFVDVAEFAPLPQCDRAQIHPMRDNGLPRPLLQPTRAFHQLAAGEISFEGRNLRTSIVELVDGLILNDKCDSSALKTICWLIPALERVVVCESESPTRELATMLHNPLLWEHSMPLTVARDELISVYNTEPSRYKYTATTFTCHLMRTLIKLSFSLDETVRKSACDGLANLLSVYTDTMLVDEVIDEICLALNDKRPEIVEGALQLLITLGLPGSERVEVRARVWPMLLNCRLPIDKKLLKLLELLYDCYDQVKGRWHRVKAESFPDEYLLFVSDFLKATPQTGEWTTVDNVKKMLDASREKIEKRMETTQKMYDDLATMLHEARDDHSVPQSAGRTMGIVIDKENVRTVDVCNQMITLIENQRATKKTMEEIILPGLLDHRIEQRRLAFDDLLFWLRKNKPKTLREQWACPPKVQGAGSITYGLRLDNIAQVYDSQHLPDTEQKWLATRFFRKMKGHFAWPPEGSISIPTSSPFALGMETNEVDDVIIDWFSNKDNVKELTSKGPAASMVEEDDRHDRRFFNIFYYLLRNYPDAAVNRLLPPMRKVLEDVRKVLDDVLSIKHAQAGLKSEEKSANIVLWETCAAYLQSELFIGIAKGTKYLPFYELDKLWKWMAPDVIAQFDRLNPLTQPYQHFAWAEAIKHVLTTEDPRRYWWLVEALISSIDVKTDGRWKSVKCRFMSVLASLSCSEKLKRSLSPSSGQEKLTAKSDEMGSLSMFPLASWRSSETLSRVLSIAFKHLVPIATCDDMRHAIADLICESVVISKHSTGFSDKLPKRFRLRSFDDNLEQFAKKAYKFSHQASPMLLEKYGRSKKNRPAGKSVASVEKEKEEEMIYCRLLAMTVCKYCISSTHITEGIFKVLPLLGELEIVTENVTEYLARAIMLHEDSAKMMIELMDMIIKSSTIPSQRVFALKFINVAVCSNIYLFDRLAVDWKQRVHSLVMVAIKDDELSVRRDAGHCLSALLQVGFIDLDIELENHFRTLLASSSSIDKQAGCLGFVAIVNAFSDQFAKVIPALRVLCSLKSSVGLEYFFPKLWATKALRDFRASLRDEWATDAASENDKKFLAGNDLIPPCSHI